MFDRAELTRLAKAVVSDIKAGQFNPARQRVIDALNQQPEHILDLIDLMAKDGAPAAVNKTLRESANWPDEIPSLDSWFEDDVAKAIGTKRSAWAKQMAVLLAGPLHARRRRWAELAAWMALSLKHQQTGADWQGFAIVASELLGARPLDEIGLMKVVADTTLTVLSITGSRRAA